jgi:hypothetical protein
MSRGRTGLSSPRVIKVGAVMRSSNVHASTGRRSALLAGSKR